MTNLRTAAEMALDTLDAISESGIYYKESPFDAYMRLRSMARGAIEALRTALAQPDDIQAAVLAERDACAKVCEGRLQEGLNFEGCSAAIRQRGEK